jgi:hypothetical protein
MFQVLPLGGRGAANSSIVVEALCYNQKVAGSKPNEVAEFYLFA